jgi:hypothetical protein
MRFSYHNPRASPWTSALPTPPRAAQARGERSADNTESYLARLRRGHSTLEAPASSASRGNQPRRPVPLCMRFPAGHAASASRICISHLHLASASRICISPGGQPGALALFVAIACGLGLEAAPRQRRCATGRAALQAAQPPPTRAAFPASAREAATPSASPPRARMQALVFCVLARLPRRRSAL